MTVNGKRISRTDVLATNGVVHFISDVIDTLATDDCTQVLTNDGRFETLLTAVTKAGLVETLQVKLLLIYIIISTPTSVHTSVTSRHVTLQIPAVISQSVTNKKSEKYVVWVTLRPLGSMRRGAAGLHILQCLVS